MAPARAGIAAASAAAAGAFSCLPQAAFLFAALGHLGLFQHAAWEPHAFHTKNMQALTGASSPVGRDRGSGDRILSGYEQSVRLGAHFGAPMPFFRD